MKKTGMLLLAAAISATSCVDYTTSGNADGGLSLELAVNGLPETRAAMTETELLNSAIVRIYKSDFSGLVRQYVKADMPAVLYLPADGYRIDVEAGELAKAEPAEASWEQMSWKGSANATVTASSNTSVTVTAKVCNVISNVRFDPTMAEAFESGYSLSIGLSEGNSLVYTADKDGKDGFFIASGFEPSLSWRFEGTLKKNGTKLTKTGKIDAGENGKRYVMGLKYTESDGLLTMSVLVDDSVNTKYDNITFIATSTGVAETDPTDIWAGHFKAVADVDEGEYDKDKVYFEYRKTGTENWSRIGATRESEGSFSANIAELQAETEYEYRLAVTPLSGGDEEILDAPSTITTDSAPALPNGGFETTSNAETSKYLSLYDPSSSFEELRTKWWDSGNAGSTTVGSSSVICYPVSDTPDGSRQSMCLQSRYVVIKFAAGNLFSGRFGDVDISSGGGTVYFGRPFKGRPTGLRLWVKYSGGTVNQQGNAPTSLIKKGDYDKAIVRIALGTWDKRTYKGDNDSPILVNTADVSTFIDYNTDPSTIALGELIISSDGSNIAQGWTKVTVDLNYKDTRTYPTHIVVSMAASMYGDYFAGYDQSKLWVDGLELLYE
ncbi:MAG: DUF4493 domain-containing protein [Bacteroidales bacterium]|nr:DUF4493 domain-containing protein [Bacteroidales bacterium]